MPERVVVLGGGIAALSAAMALTDPAVRGRYSVTVLQSGWLLGGKGASVRNRAKAHRIEEHGLHLWLGFYENAFGLMRDAYGELARPPGTPLATVEDAFVRSSNIVLQERTEDGWAPWVFSPPENEAEPGRGTPLPTPAEYVRLGVGLLVHFLRTWAGEAKARRTGGNRAIDALLRVVDDLAAWLRVGAATSTLGAALATYRGAKGFVGRVGGTGAAWQPDQLALVANMLRRALRRAWKLVESSIATDPVLRRMWVVVEFEAVNAIGMIREGLVAPDADFSVLDDVEYRAWLRSHGASELTVGSALIDALYNLAFARPDGAGAGMALVGSLRFFLAYRGAILYRMTAGMGETVFTPLYQALRARGVEFRFFHQVKELGLSEDRRRVGSVRVAVQAKVRGGGEYQPLIDVDGIDCWPEAPLSEQLEDPDAARVLDWANPMAHTRAVDALELREGIDFDRVILAIPVGAHPHVARALMDANPRFRQMVEGVKTIKTVAMQLWMDRPLAALGWRGPAEPILGAFAEPHETWADMTHLIPRERWTEPVGHLAYLCGTLDDGPDDDGERLRASSERWLDVEARSLWPEATTPDGFDWDRLVGGGSARGPARLTSQYLRVNADPSERYVLSVPGTTKHRLFPDESGFDNLVLAGDWTRTGLDAGCIEAAVMSGRMAARAISGHPAVVIGEAPRSAPESRLPRYVERGSDPTQRPPYRLERCRLTAFGLPARLDALQALVDRDLNGPARGAVRYRPAGAFLALVAAFSELAASTDPEHAERGWVPEADVAFWVPVLREGGGLAWYLPYVWVDSLAPMVSGREIYGFPKSLATMDVAHGPRGLERLALRAPVLERYTRESQPVERTLLEITRGAGGPGAELPAVLRRWLPAGPTTLVFLKQLRDVERPDRACYQAIVEARAVPGAVRAAGLAEGTYTVSLSRHASHPFAEELGLDDRPAPLFAMYSDFDFTMEAGRVVTGG